MYKNISNVVIRFEFDISCSVYVRSLWPNSMIHRQGVDSVGIFR